MSSRIAFAAVAVLVVLPTAVQAQPKKTDPTADLLAKLRLPCDLKAGEAQLDVFAEEVSKATGIPILVNDNALGSGAAAVQVALKADGPTVKIPKIKGLAASVVLRHCLGQVQATYLVRKTYIEIVSTSYAIRETKNDQPDDQVSDPAMMRAPLVSMILKEKPLNEALADLADDFEVTIIVSPQSGDNKTAFVNARFLNVPADDAIELLAAQADLRVVRHGKGYLVTSADHSNQIFEEKFNREMKQAELARVRSLPFGLGGGLGGPPPNPDKDK